MFSDRVVSMLATKKRADGSQGGGSGGGLCESIKTLGKPRSSSNGVIPRACVPPFSSLWLLLRSIVIIIFPAIRQLCSMN